MSRFGKTNMTNPPINGWTPGTGSILHSRVLQRFDHYVIREDLVQLSDDPQDREHIRGAYTHDGHYIGAPDDAKYFCSTKGIRPERAADDRKDCTVGYSAKDDSWYGWGHQAIRRFPISGNDTVARQLAVDFADSVR